MKIAIYPGSFDPITLGHLNVIKRAAQAFDQLIVCVMVNSRKPEGLFSPCERVDLIRRVTSQIGNVEVDYSEELLADYAREKGSQVIVKGLRAVSDYESEVQMAMINRKLYPNLDTFFIPSSEKYTYLSSTVVREMARYGADLTDFVPREIIADVEQKFTDNKVLRTNNIK